jgi:hypothetical protein
MNDDVEYIGVFQIKLKKKFYGLDKIDDFAHNGKPKETKTLIILTHLARRFFVPKTFFTENYKDKVVVYGTLKPQYKNLQGGSIFSAAKEFVQKGISKVKEFFSPRLDNFNNVSTRVLKQYGDVPVVDILIYRTPIPSMLNTLLNAVSFGKWNELKSKYGFDKLFHLALVFRLANGKMVIVEKNEVVNINDAYRTKPNTEVFQVTGYSGGKTLYDFINGARQKVGNDKLFFGYDAFSNNCQFFIRYILEAAGLYSEAAKNFLFQDLSKIAENLPSSTKAIAKGVTTLGAVVSKLSGKGKKGKKVGGADAEFTQDDLKREQLFQAKQEAFSDIKLLVEMLMSDNKGNPEAGPFFQNYIGDIQTYNRRVKGLTTVSAITTERNRFWTRLLDDGRTLTHNFFIKSMRDIHKIVLNAVKNKYKDETATRLRTTIEKSDRLNQLIARVQQSSIPEAKKIKDDYIKESAEFIKRIKSEEPLPSLPEGSGKPKKGGYRTKGAVDKKPRKPSAWVAWVKEFAKNNNISYGCAVSDPDCKAGYKQSKIDAKNPPKKKKLVRKVKVIVEPVEEPVQEPVDEAPKPPAKEELEDVLKFVEELRTELTHNVFDIFKRTENATSTYYYYILEKHKNDCLVINDEALSSDRAISWLFQKTGKKYSYALNMPFAKFVDKVDNCIKAGKRFVAVPLTLEIGSTGNHQNMIILDLKLKTVERFEPHGVLTINNDMDTYINNKLKEIFSHINYTYIEPEQLCPKFSEDLIKKMNKYYATLLTKKGRNLGFQSFENLAERLQKKDNGYCVAWSFYYLDSRLSAPNYTPEELYKYLFERLNNNPDDFLKFIKGYAVFIGRYNRKITDDFFSKNTFEHKELIKDIMYSNKRTYRLPKPLPSGFIQHFKTIQLKYTEFINKLLIEVAGNGLMGGGSKKK